MAFDWIYSVMKWIFSYDLLTYIQPLIDIQAQEMALVILKFIWKLNYLAESKYSKDTEHERNVFQT